MKISLHRSITFLRGERYTDSRRGIVVRFGRNWFVWVTLCNFEILKA
jgi:hypothetical protein